MEAAVAADVGTLGLLASPRSIKALPDQHFTMCAHKRDRILLLGPTCDLTLVPTTAAPVLYHPPCTSISARKLNLKSRALLK